MRLLPTTFTHTHDPRALPTTHDPRHLATLHSRGVAVRCSRVEQKVPVSSPTHSKKSIVFPERR